MAERIKITGGPWPERIGCSGQIVTRPENIYPWGGRAPWEVIVLLDDDPLGGTSDGWTCAMSRKDVTPLGFDGSEG